MALTESIVEDAALTWFEELGCAFGHGPQMAPGQSAVDRDSFGEAVLAVLREEPPGRRRAGEMHGGKPGDRRAAGMVLH